MNTLFRRESGPRASDLIRDAVAATRWKWRHLPVPDLGMITFVDSGKLVFQMLPEDMPPEMMPVHGTGDLFEAVG